MDFMPIKFEHSDKWIHFLKNIKLTPKEQNSGFRNRPEHVPLMDMTEMQWRKGLTFQ